jgi:hypothetical protein
LVGETVHQNNGQAEPKLYLAQAAEGCAQFPEGSAYGCGYNWSWMASMDRMTSRRSGLTLTTTHFAKGASPHCLMIMKGSTEKDRDVSQEIDQSFDGAGTR